MADDSGIDPRYAAQFQRGYDPERHPAPPVAPPRDPSAPVRLPGGPVPTAIRVDDVPRAVVAATASPARVADEVPEGPSAEGDHEEARPRRAVYEWMLVGASVVMILAAAWLFGMQIENYNTGFGPGAEEQILFILVSALPGPLIVGGVVGILGWIGLRAIAPLRVRP